MIGFILFFCYPLLLISVGVYISITKEMISERYFFADKNTHWLMLGISLITPSFFSPYIFGFTLSGYASKLPLIYGLVSSIMIYILGWFLAPLYSKMKINTLPEYFERRYNRACKYFVSAVYVLSNILIRLLLILIIGNILIHTLTDLDSYFSLLFFLIIISIFLIIGGLKAEIYVSVAQILLIAIVAFGFGYWFLTRNQGINFGINNFSFHSLFNTKINPQFTTAELIVGLPIIAFWFWCADPIIVQKVLSTKNLNNAKKASLISIIFQVVPILIFTLPGIIVINLFPNKTSEEIYRILFQEGLLPKSLQVGLVLSLFFALTALFANFFNSTANLITFDFYRTLKPNSSDRELVLVGRITIMLLLFISILLIPIAQPVDLNFYLKLLYMFSYFIALIAAVFVGGLIIKTINAASAFLIICFGTILIILKIINEIFFNNHSFGIGIVNWFVHSAFLEFSFFVFSFSLILLYIISKIGFVRIKERVKVPKRAFSKLLSKKNFHKKVFLALQVYLATIGLTEILHI